VCKRTDAVGSTLEAILRLSQARLDALHCCCCCCCSFCNAAAGVAAVTGGILTPRAGRDAVPVAICVRRRAGRRRGRCARARAPIACGLMLAVVVVAQVPRASGSRWRRGSCLSLRLVRACRVVVCRLRARVYALLFYLCMYVCIRVLATPRAPMPLRVCACRAVPARRRGRCRVPVQPRCDDPHGARDVPGVRTRGWPPAAAIARCA
jgi:hypothetical protein